MTGAGQRRGGGVGRRTGAGDTFSAADAGALACGERAGPGRCGRARRAASTPGRTVGLLVAVDDAAAVEVVRRQLHADAIAREHADTEAAHLAGEVREHLMTHVELDAEVEVLQSLDDLALDLDLLFDSHRRLLACSAVLRAAAGAPVAGSLLGGPKDAGVAWRWRVALTAAAGAGS